MIKELRIGVAGLGHMGRHHARVLARLDGIDFVGGADPGGDVHRALGGYPLFSSLDALIEAGPDAVVLVTPAADHEKCAIRLAEAGIHTLIEKPLANDLEGALAIRDAFAEAGLIGAVGHIERFNPALQDMKRRLDARCLGKIFSISTQRAGPFPLRVYETGVVRDLATHDIDIVHWLIGRFATLDSQIGRQIGTEREDLVEAIGRLEDNTIVSMSVNWLTPSKQRTVTVLGEKGALVADLLTSDLTYYSNAAVPIEWDEMARLKGVSEGDMTRYAFPKPEPLQLEHEGFRNAILDLPEAQIVSLEAGIEVMEIADAMLRGRFSR
jgi:UDP-N-acetylglucosamine 3-dehydrogenase